MDEETKKIKKKTVEAELGKLAELNSQLEQLNKELVILDQIKGLQVKCREDESAKREIEYKLNKEDTIRVVQVTKKEQFERLEISLKSFMKKKKEIILELNQSELKDLENELAEMHTEQIALEILQSMSKAKLETNLDADSQEIQALIKTFAEFKFELELESPEISKKVIDAAKQVKSHEEQVKKFSQELIDAINTIQNRKANLTEKVDKYNQTVKKIAELKAEVFAKAELIRGYKEGDLNKLIEELNAQKLKHMEEKSKTEAELSKLQEEKSFSDKELAKISCCVAQTNEALIEAVKEMTEDEKNKEVALLKQEVVAQRQEACLEVQKKHQMSCKNEMLFKNERKKFVKKGFEREIAQIRTGNKKLQEKEEEQEVENY